MLRVDLGCLCVVGLAAISWLVRGLRHMLISFATFLLSAMVELVIALCRLPVVLFLCLLLRLRGKLRCLVMLRVALLLRGLSGQELHELLL